MKKILTITLAALAFAACTKETVRTGSNLTAYTDGVVKTHLEMNSGAGKIYWDGGDAINVFTTASGAYISSKFTTSDSGTSAKFNGGEVTIDETSYALFPYCETATFATETGFTTEISTEEQTAVNTSFAGTVNLAVGKSNAEKEVGFKNVGGLMCFTLTQERADTVKSIEIKTNGGEMISVTGAVCVNWNGGAPTITPSIGSNTSDRIIIKPAEGGTFSVNDTYYIWVLPGTYSKGITVTLNSASNLKATKAGATALSVGRNKIVSLGDIGGLAFKGSDAEKVTYTFDFSTCPEGWPNGKADYESTEPGEKEYKYNLDGVDYMFSTAVVTDVATKRAVSWGYNGTSAVDILVFQNERFLGLPPVAGWKLVQIKFTQALAQNSGRKMVITGEICEKGKQSTVAVPGGEEQNVGTTETEYTFFLSDSKANTRYYMAPVSKGTGLTYITLVYEKAE